MSEPTKAQISDFILAEAMSGRRASDLVIESTHQDQTIRKQELERIAVARARALIKLAWSYQK